MPEEEAINVLPAVPREAKSAYCVAVYVLSTRSEMKVTNATVANAAAKSSSKTAAANNNSDFSDHAITLNMIFVIAMAMPEINNAFTTPDFIENQPPKSVNEIVVIQPKPFD